MKARLAAATIAIALASPALAQEVAVTPEQLKWNKSPTSPSDTALVHGTPAQGGPWTVRARLQPGMKVMPHSHPVDVHVTVLSGTLLYGQGETWDDSKMRELPVGSFFIERANVPHFQMPKGAEPVIFQASGNGVQGFNYVNPAHDPRKK